MILSNTFIQSPSQEIPSHSALDLPIKALEVPRKRRPMPAALSLWMKSQRQEGGNLEPAGRPTDCPASPLLAPIPHCICMDGWMDARKVSRHKHAFVDSPSASTWRLARHETLSLSHCLLASLPRLLHHDFFLWLCRPSGRGSSPAGSCVVATSVWPETPSANAVQMQTRPSTGCFFDILKIFFFKRCIYIYAAAVALDLMYIWERLCMVKLDGWWSSLRTDNHY